MSRLEAYWKATISLLFLIEVAMMLLESAGRFATRLFDSERLIKAKRTVKVKM